jgi:hypothetical protein
VGAFRTGLVSAFKRRRDRRRSELLYVDDAAAERRRLLRHTTPSADILDVNLDGVLVTPIAQMCCDRHISFVLLTGYGRLALDEPLLENAPRIRKPFDEDSIKKFLSNAIETELG